MVLTQLSCVAILLAYFVAHRREERLRADAVLLATAAVLGEDTMIRAYGFYGYAPSWSLFFDQVPVLIGMIWPPVVLSARAIARALLQGDRGPRAEVSPVALACVTGLLVLFDASLIEPIAVRAGLWSWSHPGLFHVPLIGLLGWGLFAAAIVWCLEELQGLARLSALIIAPLAAHVGLQLAWWLGLRWVLRAELSPAACTTATLAASLMFTAAIALRRATVPWRELLPRAAATGFFGVLLAQRLDRALAVYALTFTAPYLLLCARASGLGAGAPPRGARVEAAEVA